MQYWTGGTWATVPGGNVSGNNKVWRKFAFAPITTNKIRLWITGVPDSWSRLVELQAWQAEPGVTNLALNKPASQSSTAWSAPAQRGVDGNTDGNFSNGSVTHTATESQPWWQVDLQSIANIQNINVWNRTDCCGEALSNFYVFVSDNPFTANDVTSTQNQPGVSTYFVAGQGGVPSTVGINRTGRYVRVQLGGTERLSVAEVQVFGGGSGAQVRWLVTDHLGTPRMVLDQSGSLATLKRHDYLPFGEELIAPIGGRTPAQGYSGGDGVRQQFTSQERDLELSLDYFLARHYSTVQGRFLAPDPLLRSAQRGQPQSWNRYTYGLNSPMVYIDLLGLVWAYVETVSNGIKTRTYTWYATTEEVPATATIVNSNYDSLGPGLLSSIYLGDGPDKWRYISYEEFERGVLQEIADDINRHFQEIAARARDRAFERSWAGIFLFLLQNQHPKESVSPVGGETASDGDTAISRPIRVRHYTSISGRRGIEESGVIRAYDQNTVFGVRARGHMAPRDAEEKLGIRRGRGNAYVDFNAQPSEFSIIQRSNGVREFRFSGDLNLTDRNPTFHFNR